MTNFDIQRAKSTSRSDSRLDLLELEVGREIDA
jgi:hypothetical protein